MEDFPLPLNNNGFRNYSSSSCIEWEQKLPSGMSVGVCHGPLGISKKTKKQKTAYLGLYVWRLHSTSIYQHCQDSLLAVA